MSEQTSINAGDIICNLQDIKKLEESMKHILERLHALEEKERARAREEHERELNID